MKDLQITLSDGRKLAYTDIGATSSPCVMFFHGAPITRLHLSYLEAKFHAHDLRVLSADRPGYGRSSPKPGRSMADWPMDVQALADAAGADRFLVAGHSSGGPYAVACAALLPKRVTAAVVLGGITDMAWPAAWEGYSAMECHIMRMADEDSAIAWCDRKFGADGKGFMTASDFEFPEPDQALFADENAGRAVNSAIADGHSRRVWLAGPYSWCTAIRTPWYHLPTAGIQPNCSLQPRCRCSKGTAI